MKTRITLTLDAELLQAARAVAGEEGRPLSALLTEILRLPSGIACQTRSGVARPMYLISQPLGGLSVCEGGLSG